MIIAQTGVGSVLKQGSNENEDEDDEDDDDMSDALDVFGVTSVINIKSHKV